MTNPFDPRALANLPLSPFAFWQNGLQMMSAWQESWLKALQPALAGGLPGGLPLAGGLPALAPWWPNPDMLAAFLPGLPRIEANITPLKREGGLADSEDAARVSMRITMPGFGGQGKAEVLLVDAVVARAAGENALRLESVEPPRLADRK